MKTYAIRPPAWKCSQLLNGRDYWYADTVFGRLAVYHLGMRGWYWRAMFDDGRDPGPYFCDSAEDGKARAWGYYLSRLMPALEAQ